MADIEAKLDDKQYDPIQPVPIATDVPEELWIYLSEHADQFPGVAVARQSVRSYNPFFAGVGGNILGYVGRISADAYAKKQGEPPPKDPVTGAPKTYEPDSTIGLAGVEATYEDELRGTPGIETIEVDANNRPVRRLSYQPPRPGDDVQLNVDFDLQAKTEQTLDKQLAATRGGAQTDANGVLVKKAPAGSAVVLDPNNGAVKALATYPRYDPAEFVNGISQARYQQLTDQSGASALVDRAISGSYAPGSTFKLVTATAALTNHIITASTPWNDTGSFEIGGQTFRSTGANGYLTLPRAITVSSDTFFYYLGAKMDTTNDIQNTADAYGYDKQTGIDLPGEATGYVLTPADKKALHDKYPAAWPYSEWFTGDNVQLAIGQNAVAVTPLQLTNAYATFANGGTVYQPHVVAQVLKPGSRPACPSTRRIPPTSCRRSTPSRSGKVDLPSSIWEPIFQGLNNVTKSGTAVGAFKGFDQSKFSIVGKTGTAQVNGKADTSLFASLRPVRQAAVRGGRGPRGVGLRLGRRGAGGAPHLRDAHRPGSRASSSARWAGSGD